MQKEHFFYKLLLAVAAVATIGMFVIDITPILAESDSPSTDTSKFSLFFESLNQLLILERYNTYHLIVSIIIFVVLFVIFHKKYQACIYKRKEDNRKASIEFHRLLHAFREYMHHMVIECEKIVDEITCASNHDEIEALQTKLNAFSIELAKKINRASRKTANRGGPVLLDSFAAILRWNPVSRIMPPLHKFLLHFHVLSVKPYFEHKPLPAS